MTALWATLLMAATGPAAAVEAPVTSVTVFSDRARVTRTATVSLSGKQVVELPLLTGRVDTATIRLDSGDADVQQIDIARVDADDSFPRDEAKKVLAQLDALDAEIGRARRDRDVHAAMNVLASLDPEVPRGDPMKAPPKLNASGWTAALTFARTWSERMHAKVRSLDVDIAEMVRKRQPLVERAGELAARRRTGGWRVRATVTGKGSASLALSYMVSGARWYPSYDIQLDAAAQKVDVGFAGQVSQESGEDWVDARLVLSTAVPSTTTAFPKVTTWKIGERERFIPKPYPQPEPVPPPPPAAPPPVAQVDEDELLRRELVTRLRTPAPTGRPAGETQALRGKAREKKAAMDADKQEVAAGALGGEQSAEEPMDLLVAEKAPSVDMSASMPAPAAAPPPPPAPRPAAAEMSFADEEVEGEMESSRPMRKMSRTKAASASSSGSFGGSSTPTASYGIAPPPGYQRPYLSPDLPAMQAGGYDLTYRSAAAETVRSGKGARRVALFGKSFPVQVERRVFPDLAPEAFLVAEIRNPTAQPLPGGEAKLFVGADPAGVARLKTVAAGETFTLPLGIDHGVRPVRNVKVVTTETGLIKKEEISEYTVTLEIANPTRAAMAVRVVDQIPVTDDKDLESKLVRASPAYADYDKVKGSVEWRISVPASGKSTIMFVYSLKRPKGYRLHQ